MVSLRDTRVGAAIVAPWKFNLCILVPLWGLQIATSFFFYPAAIQIFFSPKFSFATKMFLVFPLAVATGTIVSTGHEIMLHVKDGHVLTATRFLLYNTVKGIVWTLGMSLGIWGAVRHPQWGSLSIITTAVINLFIFDGALLYAFVVWRDERVGNPSYASLEL